MPKNAYNYAQNQWKPSQNPKPPKICMDTSLLPSSIHLFGYLPLYSFFPSSSLPLSSAFPFLPSSLLPSSPLTTQILLVVKETNIVLRFAVSVAVVLIFVLLAPLVFVLLVLLVFLSLLLFLLFLLLLLA